MTQSTKSMERDGFPNNPRSFNSNMTAPSDAQNTQALARDEFQYNPTYLNRPSHWSISNIWTNKRTNGFSPEVGLGDSPRARQKSQLLSASEPDDIEEKTGSASLMNSSIVDETLGRGTLPLWRSGPSNPGRTLSAATFTEPSILQPRNLSDAGLPPAPGNTTKLSPAFSQIPRPPTINLNSTGTFNPRPSIGPSFSNTHSGRDCEQKPPKVYTKFTRPSDPSQRKPELGLGSWNELLTAQSPTEERRQPRLAHYAHNASIPASREGSLPPSRHANEQPIFTQPDYSRVSQHVTPTSSRAPSISSRNGAFGNSLATDSATLHLGKLSLNPDSRPSTSYRSAGGHSSHPSAVSGTSSITRPSLHTPASERPKHEYFGEGDHPHRGHRHSDSYNSVTHLGYRSPDLQDRHLQPPSDFAMQPFPNFANGNFAARSQDAHGSRPLNFQGYPSPRRLQNASEQQVYPDFRGHHFIAAPMHNSVPLFHHFSNSAMLPIGPTVPQYLGMLPYPVPGIHAAPGPAQEAPVNDAGGALLLEFKSNSKSKRWELRDIYGHINLFVGDQHGSRFIQTKLETANSDEKEKVFQELEPNALQHMTDLFGNYVIQKFFEHGDQRHKRLLADKMHSHVLSLTLQMYGCRVVQKALEHVLVEQQASLIRELEHNVLRCVKDQNGNHVIQKAIERCPPSSIGFIVAAFRGQVQTLSTHAYGCRVIQRCLEKCDLGLKALILVELIDGIQSMICDQYGNYVVQHIVTHDDGEAKQRVLSVVGRGLEGYSKHKYASNVVEACLQWSDDGWRREVIHMLAQKPQNRRDGDDLMVSMIKDQFGNYVIQKLLETLNEADYPVFLDMLRPAMNTAKRSGCGKQVLAIEKRMQRGPDHHDVPLNGTFGQQGFPASFSTLQFATRFSSAATTPPPALTADTQSFQSSRMPSVDGDTTEGAAESNSDIEGPKYHGLDDHTTTTP